MVWRACEKTNWEELLKGIGKDGRNYQEKMLGIQGVAWNTYCTECMMGVFLQEIIWSVNIVWELVGEAIIRW